jgi:DNA-binding Lrp family transcriptional regulator
MARKRRRPSPSLRPPRTGLDELDRRILRELQPNAHLSNRDLAERVGLSPAPCWRRVRRLETEGFIAGYVTLLDAEAVGLPVTAYLHVSLDDHHPQTVARFDALIRRLPEVLECHAMSGAFLSRHLLPEAAVRSVNTSFVLKRKKLTTVLPLE